LAQARRSRRATRLRLISVFRQGWQVILVALLQGRQLPTGHFMAEPWPSAEDKELKLAVVHDVPLAA
jgi:hypothetical protein